MDGPLPWLARGIDAADAVNLLQGEFSRTTDYGERWRQWRLAAALAVALLVVHVAAQALQIRQREARIGRARPAKSRRYSHRQCPAIAASDPRRQMQSRLERIRKSGAGPQYFLRTLQTVARCDWRSAPKTTINALSYQEERAGNDLERAQSRGAFAIIAIRRPRRGLPPKFSRQTQWPPALKRIFRSVPQAPGRTDEYTSHLVCRPATARAARGRHRDGRRRADAAGGRDTAAVAVRRVPGRRGKRDEARGFGVDARQCRGGSRCRRTSRRYG